MEIRLLILQRKGSYPGQYAPEVVGVCDYTTLDENPGWWAGEKAKQKKLVGDDAEAWAEIMVNLRDGDITAALNPQAFVYSGPVTVIDE